MLKRLVMKSCLIALLFSVSLIAHAMADSPKPIDVPAGNLVPALEALQKQAAVELLYQPEQLKSFRTQGVKGSYTPQDAVRLLLKGTPLELRTDSSGAMVISLPGARTLAQPAGADGSQEGKSNSSGRFLLAQATPGQTSGDVSVDKQDQQAAKNKPIELEEVVVTGSRIPIAGGQGAQDVRVYTREQIEQSGQTTISDFLNTLPAVSVSIGENPSQVFGATTVDLHGLPLGTTLVLVNGRRIEPSGKASNSGYNIFDLNSLPSALVERIEVISDGSSAVYGSDAIAGVVNIILKENFDGFEVNGKYGGASATDESDVDAAWGHRWGRGSASLFGSFQTRSELEGFDREITAAGGPAGRYPLCNPGNVYSVNGLPLPGAPAGSNATFAANPNTTGTPTLSDFSYGTLNECAFGAWSSIIPATTREGIFGQATYNLSSTTELFTELLFSHVEEDIKTSPPYLFGVPGFQSYTASASNPYNPFGVTVGVSGLLTSLGRESEPLDTSYVRALVGARGEMWNRWHWDLAAWDSQDWETFTQTNLLQGNDVQNALNSSNPATALNVFSAGPAGSPQFLQSLVFDFNGRTSGQTLGGSGFIRGPIVDLPSGPIDVVLGAEYDHNKLSQSSMVPVSSGLAAIINTSTEFRRNNYSAFAEAQIPLWANHAHPESGDKLAVTAAGRYDKYSDLGSKSTPQVGVIWRPVEDLLVRATYAGAFKAPNLSSLHSLQSIQTGVSVVDPMRGNQSDIVTLISGGNPNLRPETGLSRTLGFVYSGHTIPNLKVSVTYWEVEESNNIQFLAPQVIVNNEDLFAGNVTRAATCTGGPPCPITEVNDTFVNFGRIEVRGFDYQVNYSYHFRFGELIPSAGATRTDHYSIALVPNSASVNANGIAQDSGNWAPGWKAVAALGWRLGPYSAHVDGRYVSHYQDYDSATEIGNFWLYDANCRWSVGQAFRSGNRALSGAYIEFGGVNIFNNLPQLSNFGGGIVGYDPAQADIRGRFLYAQFGTKW